MINNIFFTKSHKINGSDEKKTRTKIVLTTVVGV